MNFTQSLVYDDKEDGNNDFVGFLQKQKLLAFRVSTIKCPNKSLVLTKFSLHRNSLLQILFTSLFMSCTSTWVGNVTLLVSRQNSNSKYYRHPSWCH